MCHSGGLYCRNGTVYEFPNSSHEIGQCGDGILSGGGACSYEVRFCKTPQLDGPCDEGWEWPNTYEHTGNQLPLGWPYDGPVFGDPTGPANPGGPINPGDPINPGGGGREQQCPLSEQRFTCAVGSPTPGLPVTCTNAGRIFPSCDYYTCSVDGVWGRTLNVGPGLNQGDICGRI